MRLELYCPNSGTKLFEGDFNGWEKTVCSKCKAKIFVRGSREKYIVKVYRLLDPHSGGRRHNDKFIMYCPHCGKVVEEVTMNSRVITNCPACYKKVNMKLTEDVIYIVIEENKDKTLKI